MKCTCVNILFFSFFIDYRVLVTSNQFYFTINLFPKHTDRCVYHTINILLLYKLLLIVGNQIKTCYLIISRVLRVIVHGEIDKQDYKFK